MEQASKQFLLFFTLLAAAAASSDDTLLQRISDQVKNGEQVVMPFKSGFGLNS